jgi:hypothetical protein
VLQGAMGLAEMLWDRKVLWYWQKYYGIAGCYGVLQKYYGVAGCCGGESSWRCPKRSTRRGPQHGYARLVSLRTPLDLL